MCEREPELSISLHDNEKTATTIAENINGANKTHISVTKTMEGHVSMSRSINATTCKPSTNLRPKEPCNNSINTFEINMKKNTKPVLFLHKFVLHFCLLRLYSVYARLLKFSFILKTETSFFLSVSILSKICGVFFLLGSLIDVFCFCCCCWMVSFHYSPSISFTAQHIFRWRFQFI